MSMDDQKYLLDGEPVSARELIKVAQKGGWQGDGGLFTTSGATAFLREGGATVSHNLDWLQEADDEDTA